MPIYGQRRRVVVTGMGAVTPLGNDLVSTWAAMMKGECAVAPITTFDTAGFPCKVAAPVKNFNSLDYLDKRDARRMATFLHFAIAAAEQAMAQAKLNFDHEDPTRVGVEIGSAIGGVDVIEEQCGLLLQQGIKKVSPATIPAILINMPACFLAIKWNIQGPVNSPVSACATGISSIGEGMRRIVWGDADVVIAGGTESAITPLVIASFGRLTALTGRNDSPERCITPFDASRDGTVIVEGAGVMVLESLEHAQARGATILAELRGYAFSSDAHHISSPREDGQNAARAMLTAIKDGGLEPTAVDYIAAHGTGTPLNDVTETKAVKLAFGDYAYKIPMSSIKSMTGHTLGAAGAIGAISAIKAMHEGYLPPTINLTMPDPLCDLDYVPNQARQAQIKVALANAFGFGGQNVSIVFEKW